MLEKIREWMNKPFTNGTYVKLCGWSCLITLLYYVGFIGWLYKDDIADKVDETKSKLFDRKYAKMNTIDEEEFEL